MSDVQDRRRFLAFLAASPLFAGEAQAAVRRLVAREAPRRDTLDFAVQLVDASRQPTPIRRAADALDVFDFEPVAERRIPIAHWGYLAGGTDDDATIAANRDGFARWALRPRRLVDTSRVDASVTLLGQRWPTPIVINPVGYQRAFHPLGELAVARAARAKEHLQVLSTVSTTSIEDAIAARGAPLWYQLYHDAGDWARTKQIVRRVEAAGASAIVFTVDLLAGSNRETLVRSARRDPRNCLTCHEGGPPVPGMTGNVADRRGQSRIPMLNGYPPVPREPEVGLATWEWVKRLQDTTTLPVLLKGIVTKEDAELAVAQGIRGLFCSNHGGRAENSRRASVASLPEVLEGAQGKIPVILDGGVRRGTDVFTALALGATAVGIGRPYIWGLGAFGQEGVEMVLAILRKETELVMAQCGAPSIARITRAHVVAR
ncbi:MAG: alpha-hydroxy-acid oxidizing protein [Gemmatimonadaceae bacterium]|jgi:isopentenyl diphosphate isomerase/L-lactate dehydrogenase-like FMN-dependent dehydrogenase|nr:alpha-hydroxy-acid oxidizing protein [Gemmatimonadaceae bacterium]